jgi:hypothetical protein
MSWQYINYMSELFIIIFINCSWVVTRWQWSIYIVWYNRNGTTEFKSGGLHEKHTCWHNPTDLFRSSISVWLPLFRWIICLLNRSQWSRGLRRRSAAAHLLKSWVRISPGSWIFDCCECCQVEVSATSLSLVQRSPTDCGASLCVI